MGGACCVAARDKNIVSRPASEIVHRNIRHSPTWSFRWDNRGRVAGEETSISWFSDGISRNEGSEIKYESACASEDGSPIDSFQRRNSQMSATSEGTITHVRTPGSDQSISRNISVETSLELVSVPDRFDRSTPSLCRKQPNITTSHSPLLFAFCFFSFISPRLPSCPFSRLFKSFLTNVSSRTIQIPFLLLQILHLPSSTSLPLRFPPNTSSTAAAALPFPSRQIRISRMNSISSLLSSHSPPLHAGPTETDLNHFAAIANKVADAASIRQYFLNKFEIIDKEDLSPVTIADRAAEESMILVLLEKSLLMQSLGRKMGGGVKRNLLILFGF